MLDRKPSPSGPTTVGAYEAKTKFSELIARAEKGESFVVTKNGRPVAEIKPPKAFDREKARQAGADEFSHRLDAQGPQGLRGGGTAKLGRNQARCSRRIDEQEIDRWLSSSTPR